MFETYFQRNSIFHLFKHVCAWAILCVNRNKKLNLVLKLERNFSWKYSLEEGEPTKHVFSAIILFSMSFLRLLKTKTQTYHWYVMEIVISDY